MNPPLAMMKWRPDRPAWRALCAAAAVVVLFGAAGIALDVTWIPAGPASARGRMRRSRSLSPQSMR